MAGRQIKFIKHCTALLMLSAILSVLSACRGAQEEDTDTSAGGIDSQLQKIIDERELTGDPSLGRDLPRISSRLAQLGMNLFFTKALGGNMDSACVTCHHPTLGGGDGVSLPVGVGAVQPDLLGPGRYHGAGQTNYDGGPTVPRNVLTTFNSAFYDVGLFWDSRVESLGKTPKAGGDDGQGIRTPDTDLGVAAPGMNSLLHAQAGLPVTSAEEMRGFVFEANGSNESLRTHLAARLSDYAPGSGELVSPQWIDAFRAVYNQDEPVEQLITFDRIAEAIAAYEASQVFVDTPWKAYVEGDTNALSRTAKRGALLFFQSIEDGGADCASCHSGDFFTDEKFHVIATPQIGRGKGDGPNGDDDFGRYRETGDPEDMYAFRTTNLFNLKVTAPYGHAGAYTTLEGMVRHHLDPVQAFADFDVDQLDPNIQVENMATNTYNALAQLAANRAAGLESLQNVSLTETQIEDLLAFLDALNDPCVSDRECLSPWILSDAINDPDGLRLIAFDINGDPL